MNTPSTPDNASSRWIPAAAAVVAVLVATLIFVKCTGQEQKNVPAAAATPTAKVTKPAKPKVSTDVLKGTGNAPDSIAITKASVARSVNALGLTATIPKLELDKVKEFALDVQQDGGKTVYRLTIVRDARDKFIDPRLTRGVGVSAVDLACRDTLFRAVAGKFSIAMPVQCLDDPKGDLKAKMTITSLDGVTEETTLSKSLKAPK